jgi:hypothetical protein
MNAQQVNDRLDAIEKETSDEMKNRLDGNDKTRKAAADKEARRQAREKANADE